MEQLRPLAALALVFILAGAGVVSAQTGANNVVLSFQTSVARSPE